MLSWRTGCRGRRPHSPLAWSFLPVLLAASFASAWPAAAAPRVLLIGVDGASWNAIDPLLAEGRLPELAKLMRRGLHADLDTVEPVISPVVWSSLATGRAPEVHGVGNFFVDSRSLRVPTLFERLAAQGLRVGSYDWLVSWPAQALPGGFVIPGWLRRDETVHPHDAFERAGTSRYAYSNQGIRSREGYHASSFREAREKPARWNALSKAFELDAGAVSFYLIDALSHRFWADSYPEGFDPADLAGRGLEPEFAGTVQRGYEALDAAIGEIVAALPADAAVILASDHGFQAHDGFQRRWSFDFESLLIKAGLDPGPGRFQIVGEFGFPVVQVAAGDFDTQDALLDRLVAFYAGLRTGPGEPVFNVVALDQVERPAGKERSWFERARQWFYRQAAWWLFGTQFEGEAHAFLVMLPNGDALEAAWPEGTLQVEGGGTHPVRKVVYGDGFTGDHDPTGVFIAAGPAFRPQRERQRLSVLDITPLAIHLAGGAIPDDLEGTLPESWLEPAWLAARPIRVVPADSIERLPPPTGPAVDDAVLRERLRSMGYID